MCIVYVQIEDAQRLVDAIDSLRPATETLTYRHNGVIIGTEEVPRKTYAIPAALVGGGWGVSFAASKVDPSWEGQIVDVDGTPVTIPFVTDAVDREIVE